MRDKFNFLLFSKNDPDSEEAKEFFRLKKQEAILDAKIRLAEKKRKLSLILEEPETCATADESLPLDE